MSKSDKHIISIAQHQNMIHLCDLLPRRKMLVIGDVMVDEYIWGDVRRISPEAPVPVVRVKEETIRLGGAANVVSNLCALEAEVYVAGVVGDDPLGNEVIQRLSALNADPGGIVTTRELQTIRKTRIIAQHQQVVRVDRESTNAITTEIEDKLLDFCLAILTEVDGVIISDYAKGVLTPRVCRGIIEKARKARKICAVDPKVSAFEKYAGATVITPNHFEASQMSGIGIDESQAVERAGWKLIETLKTDSVLVTCGESGMAIFEKGKPMEKIDTVARSVYDVTGAGDTVISACSLALASGTTIREAAVLANFAAGVVVGKVGTATATIEEIKREMRMYLST